MHLSLYIPRLLDLAAAAPPDAAPALARLLDDAALVEPEPEGAMAALAPLYGVERQSDWPLAALRMAALGIDTNARYWLRATPVLLEAGRDDVRVGGAVHDLDEDETRAILDTLGRHFAEDGLTFVAGAPHDWFVACDHAPALRTHALATALGERVRPHLAEGDDAGQWRRWGQEIEMLLHDHPVNVARERGGRMMVNAVWWQHGGVLPAPTGAGVATYSDHDDLRALAHHVRMPAQSVPDDMLHALDSARTFNVVMSSDVGSPLLEIETRFAAPIARTLHAGRVQALDVIADGTGQPALRWRVARKSWMRRLLPRATVPLADLIARVRVATA